jgi:hypothetical protein
MPVVLKPVSEVSKVLEPSYSCPTMLDSLMSIERLWKGQKVAIYPCRAQCGHTMRLRGRPELISVISDAKTGDTLLDFHVSNSQP